MSVPDMEAPVVEERVTTSLEERIHLLTKAHKSLKGSGVHPFSNAYLTLFVRLYLPWRPGWLKRKVKARK
jgi:hypothetical protein